MEPLCWGHLRAGWADRMLQTDLLRPDAMPIRPEQKPFLLIQEMTRARWKRIIQILKWVKPWRDSKRGEIKTNEIAFETDVLFK